ncbi:MAG: hypothetical protein JXA68_04790 [Ignavibacteriales bacterium]|nr:hypothetical protein [Ignavibacteriales bacterium]
MKIINDIRGYTLISVLMITFIVITLLFSILLVIYFNNIGTIKLINKKKLDLACYSAIQKYMYSNNEDILIQDDNINVSILKEQKGLFYEITVSAINISDSSKVKYLIANRIKEPFDNAIVISRPDLRATVVGKTKIYGNILVTQEKINEGKIFGIESGDGNYLIGKMLIKQDINPCLLQDSITKNVFLNKNLNFDGYEIHGSFNLNNENFSNFLPGRYFINDNLTIDALINTKNQETYRLFVRGKVMIARGTKSNLNMVIISDSSVVIESNINIENLVIISKGSITINNDSYFKNVQLFSEKNIYITGCQFDYPSIIYSSVSQERKGSLDNQISIKSSFINGAILLDCSEIGLIDNRSKIAIDEKSKVQGLIYSENNCELYSELIGCIYTYNFYYKINENEYINWLINQKINRINLDKYFLLPIGLLPKNEFVILKETWIY